MTYFETALKQMKALAKIENARLLRNTGAQRFGIYTNKSGGRPKGQKCAKK